MTEARSGSYSGYHRRRRARALVRFADAAARTLISLGGIGTIVAVSTVFVFLTAVVLPLFESPAISTPASINPAEPVDAGSSLFVDEYRAIGWRLSAEGVLAEFRLDSGETIAQHNVAGPGELVSHSFSIDGREAAFGFADGTVRLGTVQLITRVLQEHEIPDEAASLGLGQMASTAGGVVQRFEGGFREFRFGLKLAEPVSIAAGCRPVLLDTVTRGSASLLAVLTADLVLHVRSIKEQENLFTGEVTFGASGGSVQVDAPADWGPPAYLLVNGTGDNVFLAWSAGKLLRFDTREVNRPVEVERADLIGNPEVQLTALGFLLGRTTLLAADSAGTLSTWFCIRDEAAEHADGWHLVGTRQLSAPSSVPVTCLGSSQRSRLALAGYADGSIRLFYVTTGQRIAEVELPGGSRIAAVTLSPKEDSVFAVADGRLWRFDVGLKHPEASVAALFAPVQYEGALQSEHVWQSTGGDDAFEPKLGLVPLIFGTIKATVYSMLFGVPLALLAALYTSEFLHPRVRARVKPTIELMASLPSVVLGFLAALVIAPVVEDIVPHVLTAFVTIPLVLLTGAHLWQLLPPLRAVRWERHRLTFVAIAGMLGILAAAGAGPLVERVLFAGDIKGWLNGQVGSGVGGWLLVLVPFSAVMVALAASLTANPWLRQVSATWTRRRQALAELGKFFICVAATFLLALTLGGLLTAFGWDPRGGNSFLGTYVQRNALVIGFIMGFAIIPIIYTICEDALTSVPDHLRAGSLGAGATPWQTAIRIVIPMAMSGLFSAVMIGLGRAVGETMIVLMAGGNTPILEWNVFNGLRTLAANIAVELPEAPQGSTHYRTLFLAALVLFVMTFCVNTAAELVRLRFRRRAYQL